MPWKRQEQWRKRFGKDQTILREKTREALASVAPITGIVLFLSFTITPLAVSTLLAFLVGAVLLIIGMGLFTLGADMSMTPIGEKTGIHMTRTRKLWVIAGISFLIGVIVTVSEPDLQVLATQVPGVPNAILIGAVALGVGIFLVLALLRILFRIPLNRLLIGLYILVFLFVFLVPEDFLAIAFDSGGVTTGPMTVPFIIALGVGAASIRSDENAAEDSFGLVALCSIGPVLAVLLLALIYPSAGAYTPVAIPDVSDSRSLWLLFQHAFPKYLGEVAISLLPIVIFFILFQIFVLHMSRKKIVKIIVGLVYTYVGLVLFLTGVHIGFMPAGNSLGQEIALLNWNWILIPLGMLIGWFIVQAEPAVHVLNKQVEEITSGAIPGRAMRTSLSIGVAISIGLSMTRVLTGIPVFWILIPGYLAALGMSFFVPRIFTAIAFDSGGVASGPMTAAFLLPFAMGACDALGGDIIKDAFGVVALVAMTPLVTIQLMGLLYQKKLRQSNAEDELEDEEIIDL